MRRFVSRIRNRKLDEGAAMPARGMAGSAVLAAVASAAGLLLGLSGAQAQDGLGTWLTDDQKAKIELRECGSNGLCSEIVWLKEPVDENGRPWRDENHPEASKRSRPIIGIDILKGMKKVEGNAWSGEIYDPEEGKHYYLKRIAVTDKKVEIRGCLPAGWPCRTKYWTRTAPVRKPEPVQVAKKPEPAPAPVQQAQQPQPAPQQAAQRPAPAPEPVRAAMAPNLIPRAQAAPAPTPAPEPQRQAQSVPVPDSRPAPPTRAQAPQPQRQAALAQPQPQQQYAVTAPPPRPEPQAQAPQQQRWQPAWRQEDRVASVPPAATTGALPRQRTAAPDSAYLVQVTAGQDQNEALRTFGKLQSRYPQLLGGYLPNIQKVDLGERGIWYRVRVGPMTQHTAATSFCQQLKAAGADCLIRRE